MTFPPRPRGVALLLTLTVGAVLVILATSLVGLYFNDYYSQRMQQQAVQAYWNARSGVETYCDTRSLPSGGRYDFGSTGSCEVTVKDKDLVFVGQSGMARRSLSLLDGDPARRVESL